MEEEINTNQDFEGAADRRSYEKSRASAEVLARLDEIEKLAAVKIDRLMAAQALSRDEEVAATVARLLLEHRANSYDTPDFKDRPTKRPSLAVLQQRAENVVDHRNVAIIESVVADKDRLCDGVLGLQPEPDASKGGPSVLDMKRPTDLRRDFDNARGGRDF